MSFWNDTGNPDWRYLDKCEVFSYRSNHCSVSIDSGNGLVSSSNKKSLSVLMLTIIYVTIICHHYVTWTYYGDLIHMTAISLISVTEKYLKIKHLKLQPHYLGATEWLKSMTHIHLVTPYVDIDFGQHCCLTAPSQNLNQCWLEFLGSLVVLFHWK